MPSATFNLLGVYGSKPVRQVPTATDRSLHKGNTVSKSSLRLRLGAFLIFKGPVD